MQTYPFTKSDMGAVSLEKLYPRRGKVYELMNKSPHGCGCP
jgi:hypothetical protein